MYFQIKKQRAVIASISYTVTNKRILVLQTFPGQSLQSVNYVNAKYISVQQTPVHKLLNLYFVCLSSEPLKQSAFNAINQYIYYSPVNNTVDLLTKEKARHMVELFEKSKNSAVPQINQPLELKNNNNTATHVNKKTVFQSQFYYSLFLVPKYFNRYGFVYIIAFMPLIAGFLYQLGFFGAFYNNILSSWSSSIAFLTGYTLFFLIIACLRSLYEVRNYQYIFTDNEVTMPAKIDFFTRKKIIPYQDIFNINVVYSGFNLYKVNFTARINKRVFGKKNVYSPIPHNLCIPGLSKESADQIYLLIS